MNQSFYIGAVGALMQQRRLAVHGNNIANVNTHGFKAEKSRFAALMYEDVKAIDEEEVLSGVGAALWTTATDFAESGMSYTGLPMDYAINGNGFFAIANLETGDVHFTRDGSFTKSSLLRPSGQLNELGEEIMETVFYLSDGSGNFVLSETGAMIEMEGEADWNPLPVGVFDYVNYNGKRHVSGTRFEPVEKNGDLMRGTGKLVQGMLERSNADLAEEMAKVIETQRAYSLALKVVTTSDTIEETINGLSR